MNTPDPDAADAYDQLVCALATAAGWVDALEDCAPFEFLRRIEQARTAIRRAVTLVDKLR